VLLREDEGEAEVLEQTVRGDSEQHAVRRIAWHQRIEADHGLVVLVVDRVAATLVA